MADNIKICLIKKDKQYDITNILEKVQWSGDYKSVARKLDFSILTRVTDISISVGDFILFTEDTPESNNPNNDFRNMILDFRQEFGVEEGVNEFDLRNFKFRYIAISPKRDLSMRDLINNRIRKDSEAVFLLNNIVLLSSIN